jgi:hypothetical protein
MGELVLGWKLGRDDARATERRLSHEIGKAMVTLRADDDVHDGGAGNDLLAFGLRNAARHSDQGFEAIAFATLLLESHSAELRIDLLGGLFPDVAGVEDDEVGLRQVLRQRIALRLERLGHALGVFGQFFLTRRVAVLA